MTEKHRRHPTDTHRGTLDFRIVDGRQGVHGTARLTLLAFYVSNFEHDETTAAARRTIKFTLDE